MTIRIKDLHLGPLSTSAGQLLANLGRKIS